MSLIKRTVHTDKSPKKNNNETDDKKVKKYTE